MIKFQDLPDSLLLDSLERTGLDTNTKISTIAIFLFKLFIDVNVEITKRKYSDTHSNLTYKTTREGFTSKTWFPVQNWRKETRPVFPPTTNARFVSLLI